MFSFGALKTSNDLDVLDVSTYEKVEHTQALLGETGQSHIGT